MKDTASPAAPACLPAIRAHGRNAFIFVVVTVLIDMIGFGMIMPVIPFLLSEVTGLAIEDVTPIGGVLTAVYGVMNFLAMPTLGSLSDRFGRRPVLLLSLATLAVDFIIMGFAHSLWLLFVGRMLSGISAATVSTAYAYVSDVTEPEERGRAFGMIGATFGLGFIIGPVLGGLLGKIDPRAPFFAAAALALCNVAYGFFVLPESLPATRRRAFDWKRANPFGAFRHFSRLPRLVWLLVAMGLYGFSHWVYPAVWSYNASVRYGWLSGQIGLSLGMVGLASALVQGGLVGPVIRRFGPVAAARFGFIAATFAYALFALATEPWMVYAAIPVSALAGFVQPAMNQIMTGQTPPDAQGELQGAIASVNALTQILSVLIMTQVFSLATHHFGQVDPATGQLLRESVRWAAGAPFWLAAGLGLIALIPLGIGLSRLKPAPASETGHA